MKTTILFALMLMQQAPAASIEGTVLRAGTSETVRNATVMLHTLDVVQPAQTVITDDSGRFRFANAPAGIYRIAARHDDYLGAEYGARGPSRPGTPFALADGQQLRDLVIAMTPTGTIAGRVYNRGGDRVRSATVQVLKPQFIDGRQTLMVWQQGRSNAEGEYQFERLAPGQYVVSAAPPESRPALAGSLTASVRSDSGEPYLPVYFPGATDPDAAAPIDLLPGVYYSGVDLTVIEKEALRIRGRIVNESAGPPAAVFLTLSPRGRRTAVAGSSAPRKVPVASDGTFELGGVAPGSYDLVAMLGDGATRLAARASIEVNNTDVENVALALLPGVAINGRVTIDGMAAGEGDSNMTKVRVELVHEPYIAQVAPPSATVQPDGTFSFGGVIPGDYRIRVSTVFDSYVKAARLGSADILNSAVRIDRSGRYELDIRLNPNVGTVDAFVTDDKQNRPASRVQVVLVPDPPNRERFDSYRTGLTDASGRLQMKSVDPGDYKVFAWDYVESGGWQSLDFIRRYEEFGTRVHIGEAGRETVTTRLIQIRR